MKAALVLLLLLALSAVQAQGYPVRPVRMIVPFAPGGATDALGRVLALALGERLGQQVVVENRPGGGGTLGAEAGARAAADGYTLLLGSAESFGKAGRAKGGQVRAVVLTGAARTPVMPEVPTMAEAGVPDFVLGALFGIFLPAGTPQEPIGRLAREVPAVTQSAEFRKRMVDIGQEATEPLAGEAFGRVMRAEAARWRDLAAKAGVKDE